MAGNGIPRRPAGQGSGRLRLDPVLLRLREVEREVRLSHSTVYQLMDEGLFPQRVRPSDGAVRWRTDEVRAWVDAGGVDAYADGGRWSPSPILPEPQQDRLLDLPEVLDLISLGRETVYRLLRAGVFPRPVRVTRGSVRWRPSDLAAWVANLPRAHGASDSDPAPFPLSSDGPAP